MKLEGEVTIKAPKEKVWAMVTDPEVLRRHMPGCDSLEDLGGDKYAATISFGISAIKGTYKANLEMAEKSPPDSFTLKIDGTGKPGFVKGAGSVALSEAGEGATLLAYSGDLQVGGIIARVGQRMLGSVSQKMTRQFFEGLGEDIESAP